MWLWLALLAVLNCSLPIRSPTCQPMTPSNPHHHHRNALQVAPASSPGLLVARRATTMDPEAVRKSLEPTATAEKITGSAPAHLHFYDPFVLSGVSIEVAEHGRLLCSFVVTPRLASPVGYLRSGVTATLADQLGSAVFFCSGLPSSGVSIEISVSFVDAAAVGEEIEVEGKLLRAGKSVGVVSVDFRKKKTGKLMAQARHTKYLVASSKL